MLDVVLVETGRRDTRREQASERSERERETNFIVFQAPSTYTRIALQNQQTGNEKIVARDRDWCWDPAPDVMFGKKKSLRGPACLLPISTC
jgi:hypothetical protein